MKYEDKSNCVGKAMAGHESRASGHKRADRYENQLTNLVNLMIAMAKAKKNLDKQT